LGSAGQIRPAFQSKERRATLNSFVVVVIVNRVAVGNARSRQLMSGTSTSSTPAGRTHTGDDPRGVITADVNGDNKLDLVTSNAQGVSVLTGDGTGHSRAGRQPRQAVAQRAPQISTATARRIYCST
jgi:hypothetical protein